MLDVAIINWNTAEAALAAADSFLASSGIDVRVTILDNMSRPLQREVLTSATADPRIEVLLADRNLGYGRGANLALRDGKAPFVCVSNADLVPEPDAMAQLASVARDTPDAGMVGPVFPGRTQHYHSQLPRRMHLLMRSFVGSAGRRTPPTPSPAEIVSVGQASGACFVMRRETWEEVGGFDEGYFLWYDDVDLAKRLCDLGRRNLVVGSAKVEHIGSASLDQIDKRTAQAIRLASLRRYITKHNPELMPAANPLLQASEAIRARGAATPHPTSEEAHRRYAA